MPSFISNRPDQLFLYPHPELLTFQQKNTYVPWWDALLCKDFDVVEVLLGLGIDPEGRCPEYHSTPGLPVGGCTFLELAACWEDFLTPSTYKIGQILIKLGANVEAIDKSFNKTLLQVAVTRGISLCVKLLLENGASLTGPGWFKQSPGYSAFGLCFLPADEKTSADISIIVNDILRLLFKHGIDPKWRDQKGSNLMHGLVIAFIKPVNLKYDIVEIAETMVEAGVPFDDTNNQGLTPLHFAIHRNDHKLTDYLIDKGANLHRDTNNQSYVDMAVSYDADKILYLLLDKGIHQVNDVCSNGSTLLHLACIEKTSRIVNLLLRRGADINMKNKSGATPFSLFDLDDAEQKDSITYMLKEFAKASFDNKKMCDSDWKLISEHKKTFKIFESCRKELEKMSNIRFYGSHTFLQVLKMSKAVKKLANLTRNDEFVKKFYANLKLFHYYKEDLEIIFERAVELRDESLEVYSRIKTIFHEFLPELVLRNLLNHLKIKDLPLTE